MNFQITDKVGFSRESVFKTLRDDLPKLLDYLPSVGSIVVEERREEGACTYMTNLWTAAGTEIPSIAKKFIKPQMLKWTDRAVWNHETHCCKWILSWGFCQMPYSAAARPVMKKMGIAAW